jgi:Ca2+/Na+ antiporter
MRGIDGIGNLVLVIMAAASLISMIATISIERIVSHDLYSYGLQFSYRWAIPYWNTIGTVIAMAWLNIVAAVAFQIYRIRTIHKEEKQSANEQDENTLKSRDYQENGNPDDGDRRIYGITIVSNQTMQEEKEQIQIIPYEPASCEQSESSDSKQAEK